MKTNMSNRIPSEHTSRKGSYWHCPGIEPLSPLTVGKLVEIAADRWGHHEALVSVPQCVRLTFKEVKDECDRLAAGFLQLGLCPGDRLALWGPNSYEWYISRLAAARAGLITAQLDPAFEIPELIQCLNKIQAKALVCGSIVHYQRILHLAPKLHSCTSECGVQLQIPRLLTLAILICMRGDSFPGVLRFKDVLKSATPQFLERVQTLQSLVQPDEGCSIQFTSGTTGRPKAALLSNHNLVNNAMYWGKRMQMQATKTRLCVPVQFCHTVGSLSGIIAGVLFGVTTVIPAPMFDSEKTLDTVLKEKCTAIVSTPSLFLDMITTARELHMSFPSVDLALVTGAPCSPQLARQIVDTFNARLCSGYGMTEFSMVFLSQPADSLEQMISTVGHVGDHTEVKVVDSEGRIVPMGTPGELWVRSYSMMLGYWQDEENTRFSVTSDGWFKTGDQFILQENGYGRIVGRLKDVIIRGADKIFPVELKEFLQMHVDILEAEVFGVPDRDKGEEICACVRTRDGVILSKEDITEYCRGQIAEHRIPRYVRFVKEFQRTTTGKVNKQRLLHDMFRSQNNQPGSIV